MMVDYQDSNIWHLGIGRGESSKSPARCCWLLSETSTMRAMKDVIRNHELTVTRRWTDSLRRNSEIIQEVTSNTRYEEHPDWLQGATPKQVSAISSYSTCNRTLLRLILHRFDKSQSITSGAILYELMPSAFHTFKLVPSPMAQNNTRQPAPILPPSTPQNARPHSAHSMNNQLDSGNNTPNTESRMNPPPLPRSLMTPARDMREGSVASSASSSARKPRQNLEERDHLQMLKHCYEQRGNYKEGTKAQFWTGVNASFQADTGKILAQMSATVGRLVEARRRQISDWENGVIPQKPGGELNDALDQWMEFLKVEDGDAEAERMRQVDARRKVEEQRKEARKQAIAAEQLQAQQNPQMRQVQGPPPPQQELQQAQYQGPYQQQGQIAQANGEVDTNGYRPTKRKRTNEPQLTREMEEQQLAHQQWLYAQQQPPPDPPRRVIVEGQMSKEDWRDVMGNDARLRTLENKVDKIELLVAQNNKLLLQLVQHQNKESERNNEEERVPVHLDAEFERDYL